MLVYANICVNECACIFSVIDDAKVWVLDRRVFQQIMMRTGLQRLEDSLQFLKSVPLLQSLSPNILAKIADVLQVVSLHKLPQKVFISYTRIDTNSSVLNSP